MHLNFVGTTFGNRPPNHITGPVMHTRFSEGPDGILTDFSYVGEQSLTGDLDGDHQDDVIVLDPQTFVWRYKLSGERFSTYHSVQWGLPWLDVPIVVPDWNGDGKDEIAVFRYGVWYILYSGVWPLADYATVYWGLPEDDPLVGDTTGDGKTELIVWRPSSGTWYINKQGSWPLVEYETQQWGLRNDSPMLADVDRNGRDDLVVWRLSESRSYVKHR